MPIILGEDQILDGKREFEINIIKRNVNQVKTNKEKH
jgi:hypothetical protein